MRRGLYNLLVPSPCLSYKLFIQDRKIHVLGMFIMPLLCEFVTFLNGKSLNDKGIFQLLLLHKEFDNFCENEADLAENGLVLLVLKGFGNISKLKKL